MTTIDLISNEVTRLNDAQQQRVLEFARSLVSRPVGMRLQEFRKISPVFSEQDLSEIEHAIETDCENVDAQSW